jgi:two-component system cell cycle response regulator DivK
MTTVLIVEDNEMNRDMLTRRLERKGYAVHSAVDGPAGIEAARELRPDVILMDVALGAMDGWEATLILRADERTRHIPVIALTAHALESDRRRSMEVGCVDFETKPVSLDDLVEKIEKHIVKADA